MFIAEASAHTVRKVDTAGNASLLAGAASTSGAVDGGSGTARFDSPYGTAVDRNDNVYVADYGNSLIRKVTPAGMVSTFAGSAGSLGYADGPRTSARFSSPNKLAFDSLGNLFVLDHGNSTVRKIATDGTVSTFAGSHGISGAADGAGTAATFQLLNGLVIDQADNLFVADGMTIRKITPTGIVSTFAGSANLGGSLNATGVGARFGSIKDLAIDAQGNIYVADSDNYMVRKVTPQAVVTTFAGQLRQKGFSLGALPAALNNIDALTVHKETLYISSENSILQILLP